MSAKVRKSPVRAWSNNDYQLRICVVFSSIKTAFTSSGTTVSCSWVVAQQDMFLMQFIEVQLAETLLHTARAASLYGRRNPKGPQQQQ